MNEGDGSDLTAPDKWNGLMALPCAESECTHCIGTLILVAREQLV